MDPSLRADDQGRWRPLSLWKSRGGVFSDSLENGDSTPLVIPSEGGLQEIQLVAKYYFASSPVKSYSRTACSNGMTSSVVPVICWQGSPKHDLPGHVSSTVESNSGPVFGAGPYAEVFLTSGNESASATIEFSRDFTVGSAYPNPFNPTVSIPFKLPERGKISVSITNVLGQVILERSALYQAGYHKILLDLRDQGSGVYFVTVENGSNHVTQKILLLK